MSSIIQVKQAVPGAAEAQAIMSKLRSVGIHDVQLFHDDRIVPHGMWAVVQVQKHVSSLILPSSYKEAQPYILWWIKTNDGHFRVPNDQDLHDIVVIVQNGRKQWEDDPTGEKMARRLDEQSAEKDRKHREAFKQKIKDIAPDMKRAVRKELG
jgi:DNA polymerase III alpha subunit